MKKCKIILLVILFTFGASYVNAQKLSRDSLCNEFKYFISLLEQTHPDPYSSFGGKVAFHQAAFNVEQQLKAKDYTLDKYQDLLTSFIINLHDGHTYIDSYQKRAKACYVKLTLKVIPDGLIVSGLPADLSKYLGSGIVSIDGVPLDTLCNRVVKIASSENIYGTYADIEYAFYKPSRLAVMFPNYEKQKSIPVKIKTPKGNVAEISVPVTEDNRWDSKSDYVQLPLKSKYSKDDYIYYEAVNGKSAMYLRMKAILSKECFLYMKENNMSYDGELKYLYKYVMKKDIPANPDYAINGLTCYAELFRNMLLEMKKNNIKNLIVDLRGNDGGWTPITLPTIYMMYGDAYLNKDMGTNFYRLISPLYMAKCGTTLAKFNKDNNTDYRFGDYMFNDPSDDKQTIKEKREDFCKNSIGNSGNYIKDLDGKPVYTPKKIYVLTDEGTFSAAFHYTFYLWKMGAEIVGVPSSQAPNTFMEATSFKLPYTKTEGSISNSLQQFLPPTDKRAKVLWPDMMPTYNDYKKYDFNGDTELLWLLSRIKDVK